MTATLLVVDDEPQILQVVSGILQDEGFEVLTAPDGESALKRVGEDLPDLVLLDIALPGMDGLEVLDRLKRQYATLPVIMISAYGSVENAVRATRLGAYDFIEKPPHADKILLTVRNALEMSRLAEENRRLRQQATPVREIIGESEPIRKLREQLRIVAPTNASVLITGENGTGKELVARALHALSRRTHKAFVEVNCAAIPEELIESELFGHEKGAFTGATLRRRGKFDLAHEGTLFLDEIGDMSLKTQAKILRILEEQRFERVGGSKPIQVDVRVVAATNKNLEEEIARGSFREDLYHRINVIPLQVPPLRERWQDIPLLAAHFLKELAVENDLPAKSFSEEALKRLAAMTWPGNVRELKNFVWRLAILSPGSGIDAADLPLALGPVAGGAGADSSGAPAGADSEAMDMDPFLKVPSFREARALFEKQFLRRQLAECRGNVSLLAEKIGLERSHLYRKLKAYGLEPGKDEG
jgi:two-component system nitrogen regulation response regulator NtrX